MLCQGATPEKGCFAEFADGFAALGLTGSRRLRWRRVRIHSQAGLAASSRLRAERSTAHDALAEDLRAVTEAPINVFADFEATGAGT